MNKSYFRIFYIFKQVSFLDIKYLKNVFKIIKDVSKMFYFYVFRPNSQGTLFRNRLSYFYVLQKYEQLTHLNQSFQ